MVDIYRLTVWVHIVLAILTVGLALYWLIMDHALRALHKEDEAERLMASARALRWPPAPLPDLLRPSLPLLGVLLAVAMLLTGLLLLSLRGIPEGLAWWTKIGLVTSLLVHQVLLLSRSKTALIRAQFAITLLLVAVSAWLPR